MFHSSVCLNEVRLRKKEIFFFWFQLKVFVLIKWQHLCDTFKSIDCGIFRNKRKSIVEINFHIIIKIKTKQNQ